MLQIYNQRDFKKDEDADKDIRGDRQKWAVLGDLLRPKYKLARDLKKENPQRVPIKDFTITTTYKWYDVLLGLVPFFTPRTTLYSGNYKKEEEELVE